MNENAQTAALAEQRGEQGSGPSSGQSSGQPGEPQSTTAGRSGARPTFFERLKARLKPRNGSSLREDLADALSDDTAQTPEFSAGERAILARLAISDPYG